MHTHTHSTSSENFESTHSHLLSFMQKQKLGKRHKVVKVDDKWVLLCAAKKENAFYTSISSATKFCKWNKSAHTHYVENVNLHFLKMTSLPASPI